MFDKFFEKYPEYYIVDQPSESQIDLFRGVLPDAILSLWQSYGWGTFMGGYLRLVNPESFQPFTDQYIEKVGNTIYTPWAVTAFGDLVVYKSDDNIDFYDFRHADFSVIGDGVDLDILFDHLFVDETYIWKKLRCQNFSAIKQRLGIPDYGQCYGYVPLLALGGSESIEHIQTVDLRVHMELMAQVSGPL